VFAALIVLQKRGFSIVRFALVTGSVMICVLCLSNPDAMVVRYNSDRYLRGTLPHFDTEILFRSGSAGVLPAIEIYERTKDEALRSEIAWYLSTQWRWNARNGSAHWLCFESQRAGSAVFFAGEFSPLAPSPHSIDFFQR
jgi:hypothetical protein